MTARMISDEMSTSCAREVAIAAEESGLTENPIIPRASDWEVFPGGSFRRSC